MHTEQRNSTTKPAPVAPVKALLPISTERFNKPDGMGDSDAELIYWALSDQRDGAYARSTSETEGLTDKQKREVWYLAGRYQVMLDDLFVAVCAVASNPFPATQSDESSNLPS